jgi:hypothetical protein
MAMNARLEPERDKEAYFPKVFFAFSEILENIDVFRSSTADLSTKYQTSFCYINPYF